MKNKPPLIHIFTVLAFLANTFGSISSAQAQEFILPAPGVMVHLSPPRNPPILKGIKVHTDNPFRFDFILDKGDEELSNDQIKDESSKLIKYFLASLTIPEKDLWVNLSPYEKDRIIPKSFGLTEMGRDLLAEDYMLKQITASLIYPEEAVGKKFWKRIYEEAAKRYGTTNIPVNTFNKVWIVPEKAVVYENAKAGTAYVVESKLKVMLEQDYLSLEKHEGIQSEQARTKDTSQLGSQIVREIVIPELTTEVNENKNFYHLRQVYNSLILATWYKKKIKDSILAQVYEEKNKVAGVGIDDPQETQRIYQRYLQAFKKGVYNFIKDDYDPTMQVTVPRKYFSGGTDLAMTVFKSTTDAASFPSQGSSHFEIIQMETRPFNSTAGDQIEDLNAGAQDKEPTRVMLSFFNNIRDKSKIDNPLGVVALGGTLKHQLKDAVHIVMVHHLIEGGVNKVIERIKKERPQVLGLSLGFGSLQQLTSVMDFIRSLPLKERPIVVLGNIVATYNQEFLLNRYPEVFICAGQGEMTMVDVVRYFKGEIKKEEIRDAVYMRDGQIIQNPRSHNFLVDMGTPSTDFLPEVVKSGGVVYMETSRGCPFNCAICARRPFLGIGWKGRNLDDIISDMENASKVGVRFINFVDEDLFAGGMARVLQFAQRIIEAKKSGQIPKDLIFGTSSSVRNVFRATDTPENNLKRREALQLLKEAGLAVLFIGIESGSPKQLERYGKAATIDENEKAIKIVEEIGIWTIPGFIMLDPLVTIDEIKDNIAFLKRTGMDARITYPLKTYIPMKGSPLTQKLMDEGLVYPDSYIPDRLAYEYSFKDKEVANILKKIKDWEESQAMFFWELKIIFRSSRFGELSREKQELVRQLIDEQTKILLDYLEEMINLPPADMEQNDVLQNISSKYGIRLIKDMVEALQHVENGDLTLGGEEFKNIIEKGIVREVLRLYFAQGHFSMDDLKRIISEKFQYDFKEAALKEIITLFLHEERLEQDGQTLRLHKRFLEYRDIPWPDLPRPAKDDVGGIDLTPTKMSLQTKNAGAEIKFHINPAMLTQLQNASGFVPVIINIQPMTNLRQFLGVA